MTPTTRNSAAQRLQKYKILNASGLSPFRESGCGLPALRNLFQRALQVKPAASARAAIVLWRPAPREGRPHCAPYRSGGCCRVARPRLGEARSMAVISGRRDQRRSASEISDTRRVRRCEGGSAHRLWRIDPYRIDLLLDLLCVGAGVLDPALPSACEQRACFA